MKLIRKTGVIKAWDIDDVLADFLNPFIEGGKRVGLWGAHMPQNDWQWTSWSGGLTKEEFSLVWNAVVNEEFWDSLPIHPWVKDLGMQVDADLYITNRPANAATQHWLMRNGFPEAPVYFATKDKPKHVICDKLEVTYIIEDSFKNFDLINSNCEHTMCYITPRTHNFSDLLRYNKHPDLVCYQADDFIRL